MCGGVDECIAFRFWPFFYFVDAVEARFSCWRIDALWHNNEIGCVNRLSFFFVGRVVYLSGFIRRIWNELVNCRFWKDGCGRRKSLETIENRIRFTHSTKKPFPLDFDVYCTTREVFKEKKMTLSGGQPRCAQIRGSENYSGIRLFDSSRINCLPGSFTSHCVRQKHVCVANTFFVRDLISRQ